jgi:transcriptional regulator with XRE-family HTH domain
MPKTVRASRPGGPFSRAVAAILKAAFDESKMTQTALGALIGQSQSQMSKYLAGDRPLNLDEFVTLCDALGLDPVQVVHKAENP